ncbi:MAG: hypothetical protein SGI83_04495, partial [Bacteroidota bacterium]|nr:hypothetical protein [Bacteroidota bacterium]
MKKLLYLVFILWSSNIFGQTKGTTIISDTTVNETWTTLSKNWKYQKGDNPTWANSTFNDSNWEVFSNWNLNMPDNKMAIADRNEIAWFRKRIMADSSVKDALVLNIYQLGASEIYLDGKLIHQLGSVNANRDSVVFMNPFIQILQLPISIGKEQVLAIRYVNAQYKFPISTATNGAIRLAVSTLSNANSADIVKNKSLAITQKIIANYHIATGLAILMFIIFLSFYLFFPSEKINGYFSLSNFLLICFTYGVIVAISTTGDDFWIRFFIDNCIIVSFLLALYCGYCILEHKIDTLFKISVFLLPIAVILFFFYDPNVIAPISGIIVLLLFLRVAVNSWKKNSTGSLIFLISNGILFTYWTFYLLDIFGLIQNNYLYQLIPFAFMINPIALSIYLGYAFGKRSQDLRLNLEKVQQLSKDKEQILSKQNETLEQQVKERTASLNESLNNLKSTQSQLIQSEKMASLGELTAGIAHEIQNPLNFVNNFSEV